MDLAASGVHPIQFEEGHECRKTAGVAPVEAQECLLKPCFLAEYGGGRLPPVIEVTCKNERLVRRYGFPDALPEEPELIPSV